MTNYFPYVALNATDLAPESEEMTGEANLGEAAGIAAAISLKHNGKVRSVSAEALRALLKEKRAKVD